MKALAAMGLGFLMMAMLVSYAFGQNQVVPPSLRVPVIPDSLQKEYFIALSEMLQDQVTLDQAKNDLSTIVFKVSSACGDGWTTQKDAKTKELVCVAAPKAVKK